MKKLAILMILVLCAVSLVGCTGGTSSTPVNAVAYVQVDAAQDVNLTVDKNNKVIAVTFGMADTNTPIKKSETAYKDSVLLDKELKEAVAEIVKVNGTELTSLNVKIVSATGKDEDIKSVKDALPKIIEEVFIANKVSCNVKITSTLDKKSETVVAENNAEYYAGLVEAGE